MASTLDLALGLGKKFLQNVTSMGGGGSGGSAGGGTPAFDWNNVNYEVPKYVAAPGTQQPTGGAAGGTNYQLDAGTPAPAPVPSPVQPPTVQPMQQEPDPYAPLINQYDQMLSGLPGQQSALQGQIGDIANTQKQGINQALEGQLGKFGTYREQVGTNRQNALSNLDMQKQEGLQEAQTQKTGTLRDLATSLRGGLQAANNYLGVTGSGDSSAAPMYAFALQQAQNKNQASVMNQFGQFQNNLNRDYMKGVGGVETEYQGMLNDLSLKEADLQAQTQDQLNQVETWKSQQVADIVAQFQALQRDGSLQREEIRSQALSDVVNRMRQLEDEARAYQQQVSTQASNRLAQLNDFKIQLSQSGNFNPQQIATQELQGIQGFNYTPVQPQVPAYLKG